LTREGFNLDILVAHPLYNFCPKLLGVMASCEDTLKRFVYFPAKKKQTGNEIIPTKDICCKTSAKKFV